MHVLAITSLSSSPVHGYPIFAGTGKTTVARKMGSLFHTLGILPSDSFKEISASDLTTGYVGQTGDAVREHFRMAKGGVLFIDEAYQLNPQRGGPYMTEAIDEIVKLLTSPEYHKQLVVILAGYEHDMNAMLKANAGLRSRFTDTIKFADLDASAVHQLMLDGVKNKGITLHSEATPEYLKHIAERLTAMPEFSNGRDVKTFVQKLFAEVAKLRKTQTASRAPNQRSATRESFERALTSMVAGRTFGDAGAATTVAKPGPDRPRLAPRTREQHAAPPPQHSLAPPPTATAVEEEEATPVGTPSLMHKPDNQFDGLDKPMLAALQRILDEMGMK